jgi:hypothetical protein
MPKEVKARTGASARGPLSQRGAASSSSKKKKKSGGTAGHAASLEQELHAMQNPGKLKPIKKTGASSGVKATRKGEQQLEDELGAASGSASKRVRARVARAAQLYGEGDEEDDDMDGGGAAALEDEVAADDAAEMARDESATLSARMSKKILQQVHAQQQEEMDGEGVDEEQQDGSVARIRICTSLPVL